jgi:hypothetical protein
MAPGTGGSHEEGEIYGTADGENSALGRRFTRGFAGQEARGQRPDDLPLAPSFRETGDYGLRRLKALEIENARLK